MRGLSLVEVIVGSFVFLAISLSLASLLPTLASQTNQSAAYFAADNLASTILAQARQSAPANVIASPPAALKASSAGILFSSTVSVLPVPGYAPVDLCEVQVQVQWTDPKGGAAPRVLRRKRWVCHVSF